MILFSQPNHFFFIFTFLAPVNISASAPGDFQLQVDWDRPTALYPPYVVDSNTTIVDTWSITDVMLPFPLIKPL